MFQNLNQKSEQIKIINSPAIPNTHNNLNCTPSPTKKKSPKFKKNKSKLSKAQFITKNSNKGDLNLLDFYNENIDAINYFKEKKKKELLEKTNKLNNSIATQPIIINNNSEDNSNYDSSFSFIDFSDLENEEIKKEREEIIQNIIKKTDNVCLIEFDIFDYSQLIDIDNDNDIHLEKNHKKDIKFIDDEQISTYSSDIHCPKIELIKKATIKNDKNYEKRNNNFKRMKKFPINEKSISKSKNKERSRSKSIKI